MSDRDDSSLLVVLLETHPNLWTQVPAEASSRQQLTASAFIEQVLSFLNAFLLLSDGNRLTVFAVHSTTSHLLYASPSLLSPGGKARRTSEEPFTREIIGRLQTILQHHTDADLPPALAGALCRALCFIRGRLGCSLEEAQRMRAQGRCPPRLLCVLASGDAPAQYMPTMNAIFAAQKLGVAVDTCMVGAAESAYLQQAAFVTGGFYLRPSKPAALLQYLLTTFLADVNTRKLLRQPPTPGIDFSASCFCHKKPIDLGYVCSVCLSIFCEDVSECATCGTNFKIQKSTINLA